ncbi:hypothetical protein CRE_20345 [Caenorhabditis remanei]|uniref:Domain of unknown function DB domain-containing protein n=1 Tax=Caenorhabditis remanei TaxID=31234 RepID=E3MCV7_CAERE|nr:hypothetical protein CRE_20345 [Caenorhabditis remanei]
MNIIFILSIFCNLIFELVFGCPPSLSSLNLPPPVIHTECLTRNSCQRGYICRLNRCVGGRAFGSKTRQLQSDVSEQTCHKKFQFIQVSERSLRMNQCCSNKLLPERCMEFCSMSNYNESSVFRLLSEPYRCPVSSLEIINYCASQNYDHRECCQMKMVPESCLNLCLPSDEKTHFDGSKLHCLQYITAMKACFESQ